MSGVLKKYFPEISGVQEDQFALHQEEFSKWNELINCVSRKDIPFLEERHVLHSLTIHRYIRFPKGSRILDIGTGGGFPGIPLAITNPDCQFLLVDSIGKKIRVVNDLIEKLKLTNVMAKPIRLEDVQGTYDFIVSRAVARTGKLLGWIMNNSDLILNPGARMILLKGGDLTEELREAGKKYRLISLEDLINIDFFAGKYIVDLKLN